SGRCCPGHCVDERSETFDLTEAMESIADDDASSRYETIHSPTSAQLRAPPSPDCATAWGAGPQADPSLCPRRLWQDDASQRLDRRLQAPVRLAVSRQRG